MTTENPQRAHQLKINLTDDPFLGTCAKNSDILLLRYLVSHAIVTTREQPKCPSTDEELIKKKKKWHIYSRMLISCKEK